MLPQEVDLLLNDGSKHISILDWRTNTPLIQRVEAGRRHSRRSLMMSLILAKTIPDQVYPSVYCFSGTHQRDAFVLGMTSNHLFSG